MRALFGSLLAVAALGAVVTSQSTAAPANLPAVQAAPKANSIIQDVKVRYRIVHRCKIGGKWRLGRCPTHIKGKRLRVSCVHHRTEKFRHAGHCKTPSR